MAVDIMGYHSFGFFYCKESICDEEEFIAGSCIVSSMEFEVSEILTDRIVGLEFASRIQVRTEEGEIVLIHKSILRTLKLREQ